MRKATNTAQPRARDSNFAYSAWARHLSPVLANTPNYDDSPQRLDRKTRASLDVFFRDIVILMRDTGMRNQRELYRVRIENLDLGKSPDLAHEHYQLGTLDVTAFGQLSEPSPLELCEPHSVRRS